MIGFLRSVGLALSLALLSVQCANLRCPPGQELGESSCLCTSTLLPAVDGMCPDDACSPTGCPCTLEGIESAIARGGDQRIECAPDAPAVDTTRAIVIDNSVTLDGQGNLTIVGAADHRVVDVMAVEASLIGITVRQGDQGIRVHEGAVVTLTDCEVSDNTSTIASGAGGGISNAGTLTLANSRVDDNVAEVGGGGGIHNASTGTLVLGNSRVSNNSASAGQGGGIRNDGGTVQINAGEVSGNRTEQEGCSVVAGCPDGGGLANLDGTVSVIDSTVSNNVASENGGGLSNEGANARMVIEGSTVSENRTTDEYGGGLWSAGGQVEVTRSLWFSNAARAGGGLYIDESGTTLQLHMSTVAGNTASLLAGGIRLVDGAQATIVNSTVHNNSVTDNAEPGAGGDGIHMDRGATLMISSSTISGNEESQMLVFRSTLTILQSIVEGDCNVGTGGIVVSEDHNIESPGNTCGLEAPNDRVDVTPDELDLADVLADNGGDTPTLILEPSSVAVDSFSTCNVGFDQRGVSRPRGAGCDVGAVELDN